MVGVIGVGMAVHFCSKDLGLSAWVSETVFGQSGLDCFGQFQDELLDY